MKPRILLTRPVGRNDDLGRVFEQIGFEPLSLPLLEIVSPEDPRPLNAAMRELESFAWVALTSANAVPPVAERSAVSRRPWPEATRLAVVGRATEAAARAVSLPVAEVAAKSRAEGLVELLRDRIVPGLPILLPQAADARPTLEEGLTAAGARVTAVVAYDKRMPRDAPLRARELWRAGPPDWATVTSPRIGRHLLRLLEDLGDLPRPKLVSIGPVTSAALAALGAPADAEAAEPSAVGLAEAVRAARASAFQ